MARSNLIDPLDKFRWTVEIPGFSKLGFNTFEIPSHTVNITKYAEGGAHLNPRKIVDSVENKPIALTRGVTTDASFSKWAATMFDLINNNAAMKQSDATGLLGFSLVPSSNTFPASYRKDIKIFHNNRTGQATIAYYIYGAIPIEYQPASDFTASEEGISIERLVLDYEGYEVRYSGITGNILSSGLSQIF